MGMETPFADTADFSGMDSAGEIKITKVMQKTVIIVQEKGTEAAAVTAIRMSTTSAGPPPPKVEPILFQADRPFHFAIRDRRTRAVLFAG